MNPESHTLRSFLDKELNKGPIPSDDLVGLISPLMQEVQLCHEKSLVAPLDGIAQLHCDYGRIWFEEEDLQSLKNNLSKINDLQRVESQSLDVLSYAKETRDLNDGSFEREELNFSLDSDQLVAPVYLPGFRSWEHACGHHDQLSDIFSIGMIFASCALGLDLSQAEELKKFIQHRKNLFALNPKLHPAFSSLILKMTELNRHKRAQDLPSLIQALINYRSQILEKDIDYTQYKGFEQANPQGRRQIIQQYLQKRLFEISRRNKLIYFKENNSQLNLTQSSVPIMLDVNNIRSEQLFLWHKSLYKKLFSKEGLDLNLYLRFEEAAYLPSVLDKIRLTASKDIKEYGFAQLRLVLVFLHWHNLKEDEEERIHSPLLLLPVKLTKKKGVKDAYFLHAEESIAEVNPALKHHLKELYDLEMPDRIDLADADLNQFHEILQQQIQNSEKAVQLEKVDKPQIEIIHAKAKQRLNSYRKRARISGKGLKFHGNIDYSYNSKNYQPLGLQIFLQKVKNSPSPFSDILKEKPHARMPHVSGQSDNTAAEPVLEKERKLYRIKHDDANPYCWSFDLCNLTLANFNYRKMSLVQDYKSLQDEDMPNPAFDDIFSIEPKPLDEQFDTAVDLKDSRIIVPADRSQMEAVKKAQSRESYIIQGPPGTGKSQTITNLIADYASRGKRILFVCEKRAAIDVVYHRLSQSGLEALCCLIHDSQADKKAFVMDLKDCYESLINSQPDKELSAQHKSITQELISDLESLKDFFANSAKSEADTPPHELLEILIDLHWAKSDLDEKEAENLPSFADWQQNLPKLKQLCLDLSDRGHDPIWKRFPLAQINPELCKNDNPLNEISRLADELSKKFEIIEKLQSYVSADMLSDYNSVLEILKICTELKPLADRKMLDLLNGNSPLGRRFRSECQSLEKARDEYQDAQKNNSRWKNKFDERDAEAALSQMRNHESSIFRFLSPGFWGLRKTLKLNYDFDSHAVKPNYTHVLENLCEEYKLNKKQEDVRAKLSSDYGFDDPLLAHENIKDLRESFGSNLKDWKNFFLKFSLSYDFISNAEKIDLGDLQEEITQLFGSLGQGEISALKKFIQNATKCSRDDLFLLEEFASLPEEIRASLKNLDLQIDSLTFTIAHSEYKKICARNRSFKRFNSRHLEKTRERMQDKINKWQKLNAELILNEAHKKFFEHVQISNSPAAQLDSDQKEFKKHYRAGRKELEHEFSKSMRYKAIRSLSEGATAQVIRDLKPIWLMSPLSVSDTLPMDSTEFDVVIFDEASQIQLEEAIPAVYRSAQVIVVGDDKQLPPTNFFGGSSGNDESIMIDDTEYDLNADSFLSQSARNLSSTMLAWHYRSRYESLISFSNHAFYHGNLLTIPDRSLQLKQSPEIICENIAEAKTQAELTLERSISYHYLPNGIYEKRKNKDEAHYIALHVRELLNQNNGLSIGIVAFSEAQQEEIESALERLAKEDSAFKTRLRAEMDREEDGQYLGLFVKNLENVQGDERDIIILSICYAKDPQGKMRMNFGPINKSGGEKRLNVIFSRSKKHMAVISSIQGNVITNTYNDGANCLKNYLEYSAAVSRSDLTASRTILGQLQLHSDEQKHKFQISAAAKRISEALEQKGWICEFNVGQSSFRCDLAVRKSGSDEFCLAILLDNSKIYRNNQVLEDFVLKPGVLEAFGWNMEFVLCKDLHEDFEEEINRIEQRLELIHS